MAPPTGIYHHRIGPGFPDGRIMAILFKIYLRLHTKSLTVKLDSLAMLTLVSHCKGRLSWSGWKRVIRLEEWNRLQISGLFWLVVTGTYLTTSFGLSVVLLKCFKASSTILMFVMDQEICPSYKAFGCVWGSCYRRFGVIAKEQLLTDSLLVDRLPILQFLFTHSLCKWFWIGLLVFVCVHTNGLRTKLLIYWLRDYVFISYFSQSIFIFFQ